MSESMTCSDCGHPRVWHHDKNGCLWLITGGHKGCPCMASYPPGATSE